MMTKLREFSKLFIIIVALSFIGLMVFEWGADISGQQRVDDVVGSVNGEELKYAQFEKLFQQLYENDRAQTGKTNYSEEELQRLRDMVWEQFIQRTLFSAEMEKLGISVSDSEVIYQIYNYPLDDFKRHPAFQTNEVFDINKYRMSFSNPEIPWRQIEEIYRGQIPFVKLQNIISNTVHVTDDEVLEEFKKTNIKVKCDYLGVTNLAFNQNIEVSENAISKYYKDHIDEYKQDEQRQLSYIIFPIDITKNDTMRVFEDFEKIKARLQNGEEFGRLALEYSEDPSVNSNKGDLGYFEKGSMVKEFEEAAFSANPGDIVGPVLSSFGYHLIKVEDKKTEEGKEQVKASHILIKVSPAPSTVESQGNAAREFKEYAAEQGCAKVAKERNYTIQETGLFEEGSGYIPGIGVESSISKFAFAGELNESAVYQLDKGYGVFIISEIKKAGYKDLESVRTIVENSVRLEIAREKAREFAEGFKEKINSGMSFEEIAQQDKDEKIKYNTTPLFTIDSRVPGIGKSIEFNATAFSLNPGQISDLVETDAGFYYLKLLEKTAFDSSAYQVQFESIKRRLFSAKRNTVFQKWYENLKANADIVDNRKRFRL
ncbi:MAG: peptidylprolyl isomerase [Calditrichaceae bacterium]|nr:peptidylprolyl isomerase [Calditrichaceae bacterium]RQV96030.1 MAG: hypothetical protein EH224_05905 [Calditrichota bacterium]